jgi:hypothetical protein
MACEIQRTVKVEASLDTKHQTHEKVMQAIDALLRQNGAIECGIMGHFSFTLGPSPEQKLGSDPGPELKKHGVTSLKTS